jgi:hypothetical protein
VALVYYLKASKHFLNFELKDRINACINNIPSAINYRGPVVEPNAPITAKWVIAVLIPMFHKIKEANLELKSAYTVKDETPNDTFFNENRFWLEPWNAFRKKIHSLTFQLDHLKG